MKRVTITAAEERVDPMEELKDILEDDFSYFMSGVEKLQRDGGENARLAYNIAIELNDAVQSAISKISDLM